MIQDVLKEYKDFINKKRTITHYPSSLLSFNYVVGSLEGLPSGRIIQIIGDKGTGKSTLCLDIVANAQKKGETCAFIDFERTLDKKHAELIGVDYDSLIKVWPDTAEQGLEIIEALIKTGEVKVLVLDSIAMMQAASELDKEMTENEKMASTSGIITRSMKRLIPLVDNYECLLLIVNQFRANISPMSRKTYKAYGPSILEYCSSLIVELARVKNAETFATIEALVEKNKIGSTDRKKVNYSLVHGKGLDITGDIFRNAITVGLIKQAGAFYTYKDKQVKGEEAAKREFNFEEMRKEVEALL
jgi:recombination protein RecA